MSDALRMKDHLIGCADCTEGNYCATGLDYGGAASVHYLQRSKENCDTPQPRSSTPRPTPLFTQIVAAGTQDRSNLYGLTSDGMVYSWDAVIDDPKKAPKDRTMHMEWRRCANPE